MEKPKTIHITDVDTLVKLRLDYIMENSETPVTDREGLISDIREYFEKYVPSGNFRAYGIETGGKIVSAAFLIIENRPPGPTFRNGKVGTVMNVMTYPQFRGRGYASMAMAELIDDASRSSVTILDLYTTDMGRKLYGKMGFGTVPYPAMRLKILSGR